MGRTGVYSVLRTSETMDFYFLKKGGGELFQKEVMLLQLYQGGMLDNNSPGRSLKKQSDGKRDNRTPFLSRAPSFEAGYQ